MLHPDSVRRLVENFADPEVGAVSGLYKVVKADEVSIGSSEDFYWKYETFLKVKESQLASTLGGHGHLHAIRKELYPYPEAAHDQRRLCNSSFSAVEGLPSRIRAMRDRV